MLRPSRLYQDNELHHDEAHVVERMILYGTTPYYRIKGKWYCYLGNILTEAETYRQNHFESLS